MASKAQGGAQGLAVGFGSGQFSCSILEGLKPFGQGPQEAQSHLCLSCEHRKLSWSTQLAVKRGREREGQMGKKEAGGKKWIGQMQARLGISGGQTC